MTPNSHIMTPNSQLMTPNSQLSQHIEKDFVSDLILGEVGPVDIIDSRLGMLKILSYVYPPKTNACVWVSIIY